MESATDKEVWQKAKDDGYVIVTRDADFQALSLIWGQPPNRVWELLALPLTALANSQPIQHR
jgi:predicted nuclease of predicted toxin-antitoxin system